jgi:folate-binding protein YgfZ
MYKMRAKVVIEEVTSSDHAIIQAIGILPDTRHRDLSPRDYTSFPSHESLAPSPLSLGIPELGRDFLPDAITALDAGYDLLHAVSFTKGCYVGQEVTARMHYKNIARRGFFILTHATLPTRLALLKFEDVYSHEAAAPFTVVVDNIAYQATLPAWMLPKLAQFEANEKNQ